MDRLRNLTSIAFKIFTPMASLLLLIFTMSLGYATAKEMPPKDSQTRLVGTWTLTLVDNILPDGTRVQLYGPNPEGILIFDASGRYSLQILRASRPRFAANDKSQGTPDEYKTAVQGTNSHFGHYTVTDASHTITFHIEHASFPNWEGTEQKRDFTLTGDTLQYTVLNPTTGTNVRGEVGWRRAR